MNQFQKGDRVRNARFKLSKGTVVEVDPKGPIKIKWGSFAPEWKWNTSEIEPRKRNVTK